MIARISAVLLVTALLPACVRAEPFIGRDPVALAPWSSLVEAEGWWGASRSSWDDDGGLRPFAGTPGVALVRGVGLSWRMGLPAGFEAAVGGGYAVREVKVDTLLAATVYSGSEVLRGEGLEDVLLLVKFPHLAWSGLTAAVEAGLSVPLARGPDRADHFYDRQGNGSWGFPVGLRLAQGPAEGPIRAYGSVDWYPWLSRRVNKWYGEGLGESHGFRPGDLFSCSGGAEVRLAAMSWGLELVGASAARDGGGVAGHVKDAGAGEALLPPSSSLHFVPSLRVPAGRLGELGAAAFCPLGGRNAYEMFTVMLSFRRSV